MQDCIIFGNKKNHKEAGTTNNERGRKMKYKVQETEISDPLSAAPHNSSQVQVGSIHNFHLTSQTKAK